MPETEHPNFPLFATQLYSLASLIRLKYFLTNLPDINTLGNLQAPTPETERLITAQVYEVLSNIYTDYELQINLSKVTADME
nr:hypothetical protein [Candidatus Woesebacteria bacterium]